MTGRDGAGPTLQWPGCPIRVASLLFFDIETTGLRPDRGARITEIAVVDRERVRFDWTRDPDAPGARPLSSQLPRLFGVLREGVVVGHNLRFDFKFVAYEADRFGFDGPRVRYIDTLGLARRLLDRTPDVRLETLLHYFGIAPDGELHTALVDARATRALFWALVEHGALDTLADAGLTPLHWTSF